MHPLLFSVDLFGQRFALHTYGVAIALGFLCAIFLAARDGRRQGLGAVPVLDLCFWVIVGALIGSRLLSVLTHAGEYLASCRDGGPQRTIGRLLWDCTRVLHIWEGGLVYYGGFLGAVAVGALFVRRRRLGFLATADLLIPYVPLGHFFGRLGCLASGCCFGKPWLAHGVAFPRGSVAFAEMQRHGLVPPGATGTPPLHPTQLYEAGANLALFFALLFWRGRKQAHGQLLAVYLLCYAFLRAAIEVLRGDEARRFVVSLATPKLSGFFGLHPASPLFLSTSQLISALLTFAAVLLLYYLRQRR